MAISTQPKYITADDFRNYWGIDLSTRLKDTDNTSNRVDAFLARVEDYVMAWVDANTFRVIDWNVMTEYQLDMFRKALLNQAMYVFRNSDISLDSGYDVEKGIVVARADLSSIAISQPTLDLLKNAGLYNQKIQNRKRYMRIAKY